MREKPHLCPCVQWCAKWGLGCDNNVTLIAVNAYDNSYEPMHVSCDVKRRRLQLLAGKAPVGLC